MSVIVSSMSVIIPVILRALDVGDPFAQEDTIGPGFDTTVEIARMTSTRIELGLPNAHIIDVAGSDDHQGVTSSISPKNRRHSVGLGEKDDRKHRLTTQFSDGSVGTSVTTKVMSHADECDVMDPQAFEVRSLPHGQEAPGG